MSDLKVAIMDEDGNLMTYRNPEYATVESTPDSATLSVRLKKDGSGIYAEGKNQPTVEDLADYFGLRNEPKRTITDSEMRSLLVDLRERTTIPACAFVRAGFTVTPDPEPTNAERWEKFCGDLGINLEPWQINYLSEAMDKRGVTAPGGDDER